MEFSFKRTQPWDLVLSSSFFVCSDCRSFSETVSGAKYRRLILHLPKDYQSRRPRAANLIPPFCGDKPSLSNCGDVSGDKPGLPQM